MSCPERAKWVAPAHYFGTVHAAIWDGGNLTMIGQPFFDLSADPSGGPVLGDSLWSGARRSRRGALERLPRPDGVEAFMFPRAIHRRGTEVDVVWTEPAARDSAGPIRGRYVLRTSAWNGRRWSAVRTLGRFRAFTDLTRQVGSDLILVERRTFFAFATQDPSTGRDRLVLAQRESDEWTVRYDSLPLGSIGSVALGSARDGLAGVVLGVPPREALKPGVTTYASAWFLRFNGHGWSRPLAVGGSGIAPIREPQLLTSRDGLIAAWVNWEARPTLEWRSIGNDGALGPIQQLVGVHTIVSGQAGHRDLLSVAMDDGTGRALRLRADGYAEIGRYPARMGFVFPIGGAPKDPLAFVVDTATRSGRIWPTLTAYSLRCEPVTGRSVPSR